jgi:hypothetical protein
MAAKRGRGGGFVNGAVQRRSAFLPETPGCEPRFAGRRAANHVSPGVVNFWNFYFVVKFPEKNA